MFKSDRLECLEYFHMSFSMDDKPLPATFNKHSMEDIHSSYKDVFFLESFNIELLLQKVLVRTNVLVLKNPIVFFNGYDFISELVQIRNN